MNYIFLLYGRSVSASANSRHDMVLLLVAFLTAAIFTAIGLLAVIKACHYFKFYDQPNGRKLHHAPIPRLGGTVFMPAAVLGLCVAQYAMEGAGKRLEISISTLAMAVGALMVYVIGIFDDRFGVPAFHKFVIQGISALFLPLCGLLITDLYGIFGLHEIPIWAGYPLTVLLIMTIVNAINLIDGIDGLASGLCILILSVYTCVFTMSGFNVIATMSASIVGALLVFFGFNVFGRVGRLKIFMGDAGSLFLGYVCAYMSIKSLMHPITPEGYGDEQMLISVSLLFIPVMDVVRVALQRWHTGHGIFEPDKTHIHHLFMAAGLSMRQTLRAILLMFAAICGLNYMLWNIHLRLPLILLADVAVYVIVASTLMRLARKREA